jgi:uncharacterized protein with beta-barrel porin domain
VNAAIFRRAAWVRQGKDFVGPGAAFTVNGAAVPANSALTSVGAQLFFTPNWSFEAKFDGEFARTAQTYAGNGTLRYAW